MDELKNLRHFSAVQVAAMSTAISELINILEQETASYARKAQTLKLAHDKLYLQLQKLRAKTANLQDELDELIP